MSETSSLTLSNMGRYGAPKGRQNKAKEGEIRRGQCKARQGQIKPMQSKARTNKAYAKQGKGVFLGAGRKRCIGASN